MSSCPGTGRSVEVRVQPAAGSKRRRRSLQTLKIYKLCVHVSEYSRNGDTINTQKQFEIFLWCVCVSVCVCAFIRNPVLRQEVGLV